MRQDNSKDVMDRIGSQVIDLPTAITFDPTLADYLQSVYGDKFKVLCQSLTQPPHPYTLRRNSLRISQKALIQTLQTESVTAHSLLGIPDALEIPFSDVPSELPLLSSKMVHVDKNTAEAALQGSNIYVPGIKTVPRFHKGDQVAIISPKGHHVANGLAVTGSAALPHMQKGLVLRNIQARYHLPAFHETNAFKQGLFYSQSLPGILTSHLLLNTLQEDPSHHLHPKWIVDLCAAPGGKTTHLIQLTQGKIPIFAVDRSKGRLSTLQHHLKRLQFTNVPVSITAAKVSAILDFHPDWIGRCPAVILDPPCSALGVRPKLWEAKTLKDSQGAAIYQQRLLTTALKLVKPGGTLVYSTCTISPLENENLMTSIATTHGISVPPIMRTQSLQELITKTKELRKDEAIQIRFSPVHHGTSGYYMTRVIKE